MRPILRLPEPETWLAPSARRRGGGGESPDTRLAAAPLGFDTLDEALEAVLAEAGLDRLGATHP
jgi:hypothetical protein